MSDARKITKVTVVTRPTERLAGIVQANTADAEIKSEMKEDLARAPTLSAFLRDNREEGGADYRLA
jgi:hypothetical protein